MPRQALAIAALTAILFVAGTLAQPLGPVAETLTWGRGSAREIVAVDFAGRSVALAHGSPPLTGPGLATLAVEPGWSAWGPLRRADLRPTLELRAGERSLPWLINGHTSGAPDWPAQSAAAVGGAGLGWLVQRGLTGLALGLLAGWLTRRFGALAGIAGGAWLATDPLLVHFGAILGGHGAAHAALLAAGLWIAPSAGTSSRRAVALGALGGLALHVKLTAAPAIAALSVVAVLAGRARVRPGLLALVAAGGLLGMAPSWAGWAAAATVGAPPIRVASHDRADVQWSNLGSRRQRAPGKDDPASAKHLGPVSAAIDGAAFVRRASRLPPTNLDRLRRVATGAALLGALGLLAAGRRRPAWSEARTLAAAALLCGLGTSLLHPEAHHQTPTLLLLGLAFGASLGAAVGGGSSGRSGATLPRVLLAAVGILALLRATGTLDAYRAVPEHRPGSGLLADDRELAAALVARGALQPLHASHRWLHSLEAWGPELHPWYAGALGPGGGAGERAAACLLVLHAGQHLLAATTPAPGFAGGWLRAPWSTEGQLRLGRWLSEPLRPEALRAADGTVLAWLTELPAQLAPAQQTQCRGWTAPDAGRGD